MKFFALPVLLLALCSLTIGCRAEVSTTDDSHKVEVEVPKLELGEMPVDADVKTDSDIDVDTPTPGDN